MGTRLGLHLEGVSRPRLLEASSRMLEAIDRIEAACSTWLPDSAWSRLNGAGGAPVILDVEWMDLLATAQAWHHRTGGTFDPVILALLRAWGTTTGGRIPAGLELEKARGASGCGLLCLDRAAGTAQLLHPGAGVEGGGFVKGYALDAALGFARDQGIPSGWLAFGGQLLAWGACRDVVLAGADDRLRPCLRLRLPEGASLSVSGCSERGRHLLDPRSGLPCADWGAAAVVAASGLEAEVLSTALYVLGPAAGPAWARERGLATAFLLRGAPPLLSPGFAALEPMAVAL